MKTQKATQSAFCILICLLVLGSCQTVKESKPSSTFDASSDGWTVVGDAQGNGARPTYHGDGGNPGGYISAKDNATGGTWYWSAPAKFRAYKGLYGSALSFDLKQTKPTKPFDAEDVIFESESQRIVFALPNHPGTDWTHYSVLISEGGWRLKDLDGKVATKGDVQSVLGSLKGIYIRGEYENGPDTGSLDNVRLE